MEKANRFIHETVNTTDMKNKTNMYAQNVDFPDVFKGCRNGCGYCVKSFQQQAKRQKQNCMKCYTFEPHNHFERMKGRTPVTRGEQFIFFPKGGDPCYATAVEFKQMLTFIRANPQSRFLIQTKRPKFLLKHCPLPANVLVGITLESTESNYITPVDANYKQISPRSTPLLERAEIFATVPHAHKSVTIEPILQFNLKKMLEVMHAIKPEVVYVGYDTKKCKLPEPTLAETTELINALKQEGFHVRLKQIRRAWYEN